METLDTLETRGVKSLPIGKKEVSEVPWVCGDRETCCLLDRNGDGEIQCNYRVISNSFLGGHYFYFPCLLFPFTNIPFIMCGIVQRSNVY